MPMVITGPNSYTACDCDFFDQFLKYPVAGKVSLFILFLM